MSRDTIGLVSPDFGEPIPFDHVAAENARLRTEVAALGTLAQTVTDANERYAAALRERIRASRQDDRARTVAEELVQAAQHETLLAASILTSRVKALADAVATGRAA